MLDTLVDLFAPIWVGVMFLGGILVIYGIAAFFISIGEFWKFLKTGELQYFHRLVKFSLIFAPFALIAVLNAHDRYVTCERDFAENTYMKGRYIAQEMEGKLLSHDCVKYRKANDLPWLPKDDAWND